MIVETEIHSEPRLKDSYVSKMILVTIGKRPKVLAA